MRQWWALGTVLLLCPVLQGAGCRTHHTPRFKGQIQADESVRYAHSGHKVIIVFRPVAAGASGCSDWPACLTEDNWSSLKACTAPPDDDPGGDTTTVVLSEGQAAASFDACSAMLGVDYAADIAAFVDLNDDGKASPGEPFGAFEDGPMKRDREQDRIIIRISETLPGGADEK